MVAGPGLKAGTTFIGTEVMAEGEKSCPVAEFGGNMAEKTQIAPFAIFISGNAR